MTCEYWSATCPYKGMPPTELIISTTAAAAFAKLKSVSMFGPTDPMLQDQQRIYYNALKQHIEGT
jgi:hypothetical protein